MAQNSLHSLPLCCQRPLIILCSSHISACKSIGRICSLSTVLKIDEEHWGGSSKGLCSLCLLTLRNLLKKNVKGNPSPDTPGKREGGCFVVCLLGFGQGDSGRAELSKKGKGFLIIKHVHQGEKYLHPKRSLMYH